MALKMADIREKLLKIAESLKESRLFKGAKSFFDDLLGKIPENKRIPVLAAGGGCLFLIISIIIIAAAGNRSGTPREGGNALVVSGPHIPAEDLFYPAEPDFLPGLLLEREPRQPWTAEDAGPFWKDPSESVDFWQEKMSETIDKLMESVP
jgi:hypothetical protein